jgi:type VI secretion system protein ImpE
MMTAEQLIAAGLPRDALATLQRDVREHPADARLRIFLFQLLCVLGQWERALTQLQICGELDAGALAMVSTYREAIQCEALREAVFAGKTTPMILGQPPAWIALLIEALQADERGDAASSTRLRSQAFEAAPATAGSMNGKPFAWIADADSRLGPVLEAVINGRYCWVPFASLAKVVVDAPTDLRDMVWIPAHLAFINGGESVALIPSRYPGSGESADGALQMSRKTEWLEIGAGQYRGLGQRVLTTDADEVGLLDVRELSLRSQPTGPGEAGG